MKRPILTFNDTHTSPHRSHVITQAEAMHLAIYFNGLDELEDADDQWGAEHFVGKTIEEAGFIAGDGFCYKEENIQHIICELFNYEGVY